MAYRDQLNTYEWKRFSSRIVEDQESCWSCDAKTDLDVHHMVYRDVKAWEYEDSEVRVLCRKCHKAVHHVSDLIWVATLRFEPHELEILLKRIIAAKSPENWDHDEFSDLGEITRGVVGAWLPNQQ
jgi:hypothetical protein